VISNTFSLCSSLNVRYKASHPYKITDRIKILQIWTFTFLGSRREDKRLWTEWWQAFSEVSLLLISSCTHNFDLLVLFPSIWSLPHLKHIYAIFMPWFCPASDYVTLTYTQFSLDSLPDHPPY
jgi:hypothetical protein